MSDTLKGKDIVGKPFKINPLDVQERELMVTKTATNVIMGLVEGDKVNTINRVYFHILTALPLRYESNVIAATDGSYLYVGDGFLEFSREEQEFILFHEVMHNIFQHPLRGMGRIHDVWNIAADYMVNGTLENYGFHAPKGSVINRQYDVKAITTNDIYLSLLSSNNQENSNGNGKNFGEGAGKPTTTKDPLANDLKPYNGRNADIIGKAIQEAEKIASTLASVGSSHTKSVAERLSQLIRSMNQPRINDWRGLLEAYVSKYTTNRKYTFALPHKKFINSEIYMPRRVRTKEATVAVVVDTSGSVSDEMLSEFMVEVENIFNTELIEGYFVLFAGSVYRVDKIPPFPSFDSVDLDFDRGSTVFGNVLEWAEKEGAYLDLMIVLTDMEIEENLTPPSYPVIWVTKTPNPRIKFGDIIDMS